MYLEDNFKNKLKMYIASPLFNKVELEFNLKLKNILSKYFDIYLPQEDCGLMNEMIKNGMNPSKAAQKVFTEDILAIKNCDLLLIVMDGRCIDEGASFELGFAFANNKKCIGLQTDIRRLVGSKNNPMIDCALFEIFNNIDDVCKWAEENFLNLKCKNNDQNNLITSFSNKLSGL